MTAHREQVRLACEAANFDPHQMMEHLVAQDANAIEVSLKMVEEADVYLGIFGHRYGEVPEGHSISITEMEYNHAVKHNKPRLNFFIHDDHPLLIKDVDTGPGAEKLKALKERIRKDRVAAWFRSPAELRAHATEALNSLARDLDKKPGAAGATGAAPAQTELPSGWEIVTREDLAGIRAHPPTPAEVIAFFDGSLPTWKVALAPGVQRRAIVDRLAQTLRLSRESAATPSVLLLAGAGGEGKSTAILHVAASLLEDTARTWSCLRRRGRAAPLPVDLLEKLPHAHDHAWIVVIDDADNIGSSILAAVKRIGPRTDVHVLLSARDADWQVKRLPPALWLPEASFKIMTLAGLDSSDARKIVAGWRAWGENAMGKLQGYSEIQAEQALMNHARQHAVRMEKGELLGALLRTRHGEDMRSHVRLLMHGLSPDIVVGSSTLKDIYCAIAAMHAENQLYLSPAVLARAAGCSVDDLESQALSILREEAMLDAGDAYLLTRHRFIAEAACSVMREDGIRVDDWFPRLARAGVKEQNANIAEWRLALPEHFTARKERWPTARAVAKALYEAAPKEAQRLTVYSGVLRRTGQPQEAMSLLKAQGDQFSRDRAFLYDWSTVAGAVKDFGLDAWLCGRSLADGGDLTAKQCKLSLSGLSAACREMFDRSSDVRFATARGACGMLGLGLPDLDAKARDIFREDISKARQIVPLPSTAQHAVNALHQAVVLGSYVVEPGNDPVYFESLLAEPDGYRFSALLRIAASGKWPPEL